MGGLGTPAVGTEGEGPTGEGWQADGDPVSAAGETEEEGGRDSSLLNVVTFKHP